MGNANEFSLILRNYQDFSGILRKSQEILDNSQEFSGILRNYPDFSEHSDTLSNY
jgi:hypothetical protein